LDVLCDTSKLGQYNPQGKNLRTENTLLTHL
jgi:hypothetical protein